MHILCPSATMSVSQSQGIRITWIQNLELVETQRLGRMFRTHSVFRGKEKVPSVNGATAEPG